MQAIKTIYKSFENNRVVLLWFTLFLLFLSFTSTQTTGGRRLIDTVQDYWTSGALKTLIPALSATLSVALPVSVLILAISLLLACLSYFKSHLSPYITMFTGISLLPTVYLIFAIRVVIPQIPVDNKLFLVFVLTFSNLILFFFYMGFKKELHQEFAKEYHSFARMLGVRSILASSAKKIAFILMERFKTLFILVFSSTIFAEHKLDISGGVYTIFYKTVTTGEGRPDIFYGQLLFVLSFVVIFLIIYDITTNFIKRKHY